MRRGVLYIVWGDRIEATLQRSIASVGAVHPELPIHVERLAEGSLREKARMGAITPFESTLYLDADTVVLGRLDHAFEKAEQFTLACSICEAPWMRRYGREHGDAIEYNTGVLFFTQGAAPVFAAWELFADGPATSQWTMMGDPPKTHRGLQYDDQASFGCAIEKAGWNPFVLPINYNLRPFFHCSFFAPVKVWHDYSAVPADVARLSADCEANDRPITYCTL